MNLKKVKKLKLKLKKKKQKNNHLIFFGLGNPGDIYRETRHNAGFAVIDLICSKFHVTLKKAFLRPVKIGTIVFNNTQIYLVKPLTFMNRSGDVIAWVLRKTGADVDDIVLICDNMDLKPGIIRLKKKGSSAGHNGIKSFMEQIGTSEFKRLYIGVGRSQKGESVIEHVLGSFDPEEKIYFKAAVEQSAEVLLSLTEKELDMVMNEINKRNN